MESYICSSVSLTSVLLCGSRFAPSEAGVAEYRQEDSYPFSLRLAKIVCFCDFYGVRFCCKVCLRILENAIKKLEILLLVRMLGYSQIIWRDVTVSVIQIHI